MLKISPNSKLLTRQAKKPPAAKPGLPFTPPVMAGMAPIISPAAKAPVTAAVVYMSFPPSLSNIIPQYNTKQISNIIPLPFIYITNRIYIRIHTG